MNALEKCYQKHKSVYWKIYFFMLKNRKKRDFWKKMSSFSRLNQRKRVFYGKIIMQSDRSHKNLQNTLPIHLITLFFS